MKFFLLYNSNQLINWVSNWCCKQMHSCRDIPHFLSNFCFSADVSAASSEAHTNPKGDLRIWREHSPLLMLPGACCMLQELQLKGEPHLPSSWNTSLWVFGRPGAQRKQPPQKKRTKVEARLCWGTQSLSESVCSDLIGQTDTHACSCTSNVHKCATTHPEAHALWGIAEMISDKIKTQTIRCIIVDSKCLTVTPIL